MTRMYVLSNTIATFTDVQTIVELGALTNTVLKIHRIKVGQSTTEVDDSTLIQWGTYTASGTGTDVKAKAVPLDPDALMLAATTELQIPVTFLIVPDTNGKLFSTIPSYIL